MNRLVAVLAAMLVVTATGIAATAPSRAGPKAKGSAAAHPKHPDFSGTWALDTTRSDFGKIIGGRPIARTDVIVHRDPRLDQTLYLMRTPGTRDTTVYHYTTDSARVVHRIDDRDIEARVWWSGDTLRLESRSKLMMFELGLSERWTLSPDGKTLTMARRVKSPVGGGDATLRFVKR